MEENQTERHRLQNAEFCRDPFCPVCQSAAAGVRRQQVTKAMPKLFKDKPGLRFIMLTLTIENPPIDGVRKVIDSMNKAFTKMMRSDRVQHYGYIRALEVSMGETGVKRCHPHFHVLIAVPADYFDKNKALYISTEEWSRLWAKYLKIDYDPTVYVTAVKENSELSQSEAIGEIVKYCSKPTDLLKDKQWTLTYIKEILGLKRITTAGLFRKHLSALEQEPDDLIVRDSQEGEEGELVTYEWDFDLNDYVLVDYSPGATRMPFHRTKKPQYKRIAG